jgi:oligopeptidase A
LQAFKVLIKDKRQVAGLPVSTLDVAAQNARAAGRKGAATEKGPWLLLLDDPTYKAVILFAKDRNMRKKFYIAHRNVASSGKWDNTPIIAEILKLRKEMAAILGYPNYAQYAFQDRVRLWQQGHTTAVNSLCIGAAA